MDIVSICSCLHKHMLCSRSIDCCRLGVYQFLTGFAKTRHYDAFLKIPDFCIGELHMSKALFCSNINAVLQRVFELQG